MQLWIYVVKNRGHLRYYRLSGQLRGTTKATLFTQYGPNLTTPNGILTPTALQDMFVALGGSLRLMGINDYNDVHEWLRNANFDLTGRDAGGYVTREMQEQIMDRATTHETIVGGFGSAF
eukprot:6226536-Pyramimonas_sp.AAC.1